MIPNNTEWAAKFNVNGTTRVEAIIAWDENGHPLVLGPSGLIQADYQPSFHAFVSTQTALEHQPGFLPPNTR